jgi:hypothetical protein
MWRVEFGAPWENGPTSFIGFDDPVPACRCIRELVRAGDRVTGLIGPSGQVVMDRREIANRFPTPQRPAAPTPVLTLGETFVPAPPLPEWRRR